eukprot:MONOS_6226.1-p1 / transcript=MONOS_6226.1 / gene=MONOS_6226 / organism=Monocercomonoides_exilis_PA203 / gene_product=Replication factor C subunit 1, RFC1 / transcript_product=Replication factor C subunit 1, RFC1 / location=Mono_scaffold00193:53979-59015(+) / protein_length=1341 / sequence_SO=supercontig / SO=protein_coding / is_pseudo=false
MAEKTNLFDNDTKGIDLSREILPKKPKGTLPPLFMPMTPPPALLKKDSDSFLQAPPLPKSNFSFLKVGGPKIDPFTKKPVPSSPDSFSVSPKEELISSFDIKPDLHEPPQASHHTQDLKPASKTYVQPPIASPPIHTPKKPIQHITIQKDDSQDSQSDHPKSYLHQEKQSSEVLSPRKQKRVEKEVSKPLKEKKETKEKEEDSGPAPVKGKFNPYLAAKSHGPANPGKKQIPVGQPNCLAGLHFAVTGQLDSMGREQCIDLIKQYGGTVHSSVSKTVNYLIQGKATGFSKAEKAKKLGTKVLNEDEFFDLLKNNKAQDTQTVQTLTIPQKLIKATVKPTVVNSSLWAQKYRPTKIADIMGNQTSIQELLNWLKNWTPTKSAKKTKGRKKKGKKGEDEDDVEEEEEEKEPAKGNKRSKYGKAVSEANAALISGQPGIGKTTAAHVVCKEAGYEVLEFNASDTRSKNALTEAVSNALQSFTLQGFWGTKKEERQKMKEEKQKMAKRGGRGRYVEGELEEDDDDEDDEDDSEMSDSGRVTQKHITRTGKKLCVIMDEVDGMAGGDRGGMAELVKLIDETSVPIICICNDKTSPKIRTLRNKCLDLPFQRPHSISILNRIIPILNTEGCTVDRNVLETLIQSTGGDIRQILNVCQMWKDTPMDYQHFRPKMKAMQKDVAVTVFTVVPKFLSSMSYHANTINERIDYYFVDNGIVPLFMQENYIRTLPAYPLQYRSLFADPPIHRRILHEGWVGCRRVATGKGGRFTLPWKRSNEKYFSGLDEMGVKNEEMEIVNSQGRNSPSSLSSSFPLSSSLKGENNMNAFEGSSPYGNKYAVPSSYSSPSHNLAGSLSSSALFGLDNRELREEEIFAAAAESVSFGDVIEAKIRSEMNWTLAPMHAVQSTITPGFYVRGYIQEFGYGKDNIITFPTMMGQMQTMKKGKRMCHEFRVRASPKMMCPETRLQTDGVLKVMRLKSTLPLMDIGNEEEEESMNSQRGGRGGGGGESSFMESIEDLSDNGLDSLGSSSGRRGGGGGKADSTARKERIEEAVDGVISFLDEYNMSRVDWDDLIELTTFKQLTGELAIPGPIKAAFTRRCNAEHGNKVSTALTALDAVKNPSKKKNEVSVAAMFIVGGGSGRGKGKSGAAASSALGRSGGAGALGGESEKTKAVRMSVKKMVAARVFGGKSISPLRKVLQYYGLTRLLDAKWRKEDGNGANGAGEEEEDDEKRKKKARKESDIVVEGGSGDFGDKENEEEEEEEDEEEEQEDLDSRIDAVVEGFDDEEAGEEQKKEQMERYKLLSEFGKEEYKVVNELKEAIEKYMAESELPTSSKTKQTKQGGRTKR